MAQSSSDRLSKIPKLKVPTSTPTDPSQPNHSRSRNMPADISTADGKQHHHGKHHPHHGFIHPPHDATLFSPMNTNTDSLNPLLSQAPGVIPPFTSPTVPRPHSQPFSDQDTPSGTEDAAALGAPPNLAIDLEEALIEEVQKNPGLTTGARIEDLVAGGEGGSNLTPGEVGTTFECDVKDEITWESDGDEEGEEDIGGKNDEYVESSKSSASGSGGSEDSGYDDKSVPRNPDSNMNTGLEYDEGYIEGEDNLNGVDAGVAGGSNWNNMSNDIHVDPRGGLGESDVQMDFGGVFGEWNGVEALEPEEDEAVDGYEGTGNGAHKHDEEDVWW